MNALPILSERAVSASRKLVNCSGCTACCERGGLVYVHDEEVKPLKSIGVPMITIGGVAYIQRLPDGSCPMLDRKKRECSIYENRPLCCRLFPLDVLSIEGKLQWALFTLCPEDRKRFEGSQGPSTRIGSGSIARIASSLETVLDDTDVAYLERKELVSARVEILEDNQNNWTPVAECVGLDLRQVVAGKKTKKAGKKIKKKETPKEKLMRKLKEKNKKKEKRKGK